MPASKGLRDLAQRFNAGMTTKGEESALNKAKPFGVQLDNHLEGASVDVA
jgi:hypothetical protein